MAQKTARKPKPGPERRSEPQSNRASLPATALFSFLKETRGITSWTTRDFAKTLNLSTADAKEALAILEMQGYVKPTGSKQWITTPAAEATFLQDAELVFMFPHVHYRGKDMTYTLEYPDGRKEVVLSVPHYDFNWQLGYQTSVKVPKGTKLRADAHFDNSVGNRFNPNPNRTVYYGEMTWEEMMTAFFGVVVDNDNTVDRRKIVQTRVAANPGA